MFNQSERIMQIITFPTTLHCERVWGYLVRYNGIVLTEGYGLTKEIAERMANEFIDRFSAW